MESDPALYYLTNKLSDTRFSPISSQDIKKIYQNIVPYMNSQDPFPDKDTDIYKKAIAKIKITETSETIRKNLFLLVEIYDYFCILDDDPESSTYEVKIHKLYDFLGLDKNLIDYIYGNVPDGCIPCREIAEKLALYKIPISYFRSDSPTIIDCSHQLIDAIEAYFNDLSIEDFRDKLYFSIGYQMDLKCKIPVLGMYSLYQKQNA